MSHVESRLDGHVLKTRSGQHMFLSGHYITITVLNEYKLFPRSQDDGTIINTPL